MQGHCDFRAERAEQPVVGAHVDKKLLQQLVDLDVHLGRPPDPLDDRRDAGVLPVERNKKRSMWQESIHVPYIGLFLPCFDTEGLSACKRE
jgi:hypothetical protein